MTDKPSPAALREREQFQLMIAAAALVVISVLFGGASRQNPIRLGVVELSSLPLLVMALRQLSASPDWRAFGRPIAILAAIYGVIIVQLIPLPPGIWTQLPGHAAEARALQLAGLPVGWRPISLSPQEGLLSLLALAPPTAMFFGALCLTSQNLKLLIQLWMVLAVLSIALGVFQLIWPEEGSWVYPYSVTHYGSLVGFFANRNHEATLLVVLLPLAAVLIVGGQSRRRRFGYLQLLATAFIVLVCIGLTGVHSRMGISLAGPAILACGMIVWLSPSRRSRLRTAIAVGSATLAIAFISGAVIFGPLLARFETLPDERRFVAWPNVEHAADLYLPLGSGIGSFDPVFRSIEPLSMVESTYFNHAHHEYLEVWLETGWLGIAVLIAFLLWLVPLTFHAWVGRGQTRVGWSRDLARAASTGVLLVMAHSFVDYPLRTTTISVLFAYACAALALFERARRQVPNAATDLQQSG
jgi:O-antigen ligase